MVQWVIPGNQRSWDQNLGTSQSSGIAQGILVTGILRNVAGAVLAATGIVVVIAFSVEQTAQLACWARVVAMHLFKFKAAIKSLCSKIRRTKSSIIPNGLPVAIILMDCGASQILTGSLAHWYQSIQIQQAS
jgi:hypothetical protein